MEALEEGGWIRVSEGRKNWDHLAPYKQWRAVDTSSGHRCFEAGVEEVVI